MIDPTMPIDYDFGPHVAPVAMAARDAYFQGRSAASWSALKGPQTFRWLMLVDATWYWPDDKITAQAIRDIYLMLVAAKPWKGLKSDDKERWRNVRMAILEARKEWRRAEPEAVAPASEPRGSIKSDISVATLTDRLKARRQGVTQ